MSENNENTLPALTEASGDIALSGDATGIAISSALHQLMTNLHHRSESFDDVHVSFDNERHANGSTKSHFSYRCYRHKR
jgi:hypothetical protein